MAFFAARGMSLPVESPKKELLDACRTLLDPSERTKMLQAQHTHLPQNASSALCDLIESDLAEK